MTSTRTPWGYYIEGELPSLMTAEDFQTITGGVMSSSTEKIQATLDAVSAVIRAYCRWHVAPVLECTWQGDADGRLIQLPAMNATSVHSVQVGGKPAGHTWRQSGLIRLDTPVIDDWGQRCQVEYSAGIDGEQLAAVVSQLAVNALVAPAGVMREQAGDVSITYNQTAVGISGGIRLLASDKALLDPYRLPSIG